MSTKNKTKLKGGEFLLKESLSNEIFTPEDFSQEQLMMNETVPLQIHLTPNYLNMNLRYLMIRYAYLHFVI